MDNLTIIFFFCFLFCFAIIHRFAYYKHNYYTKYNIYFICLFTAILFTFLYIVTNFIISQYKLVNINRKNPQLSISDENKSDIKYIEILSIISLVIFALMFLIHIFRHMFDNQYAYINNKYKVSTLFASLLTSILIIIIYLK
jgi:hypothetical protein